MKRIVGYVLLGLCAYLVFLVLQFPVGALAHYLATYLPGLQVQHIEGSIVQGRALGLNVRGVELESLAWRWQPLSLLGGRFEYRFSIMEPQLKLQGRAGVGLDQQLRIVDLDGEVSLNKAIAMAVRAQLPVNGKVEVELAELRIGADGLPRAVYGTTRLLDARTTLGRTLNLGDFSTELTTEKQGIVGTVRDIGGPLEMIGTLTLAPNGHYRFNGQVGVRDDNNQELRQVLSLLGRVGTDGKWSIDFTGMLKV